MRRSLWLEGDNLIILSPDRQEAVTLNAQDAAQALLQKFDNPDRTRVLVDSIIDQKKARWRDNQDRLFQLGLKWVAHSDPDLRLAADVLLVAVAEMMDQMS